MPIQLFLLNRLYSLNIKLVLYLADFYKSLKTLLSVHKMISIYCSPLYITIKISIIELSTLQNEYLSDVLQASRFPFAASQKLLTATILICGTFYNFLGTLLFPPQRIIMRMVYFFLCTITGLISGHQHFCGNIADLAKITILRKSANRKQDISMACIQNLPTSSRLMYCHKNYYVHNL